MVLIFCSCSIGYRFIRPSAWIIVISLKIAEFWIPLRFIKRSIWVILNTYSLVNGVNGSILVMFGNLFSSNTLSDYSPWTPFNELMFKFVNSSLVSLVRTSICAMVSSYGQLLISRNKVNVFDNDWIPFKDLKFWQFLILKLFIFVSLRSVS